ncbi:hypothetical protein SMACR_09550 [Sordaria macrospora]|uniref:Uncharacterized protein n=1 Tax=Sordaria macrospora TaxID=5147 RepID=A0A8S8ZS03_SORMA|nr:hypothetical protein SMACR_09550 [Sordaria macrospora]KAH7628211.1 hypothetical protein B0T09DRAFT_177236 [Sordaria sp. MPI-SDFR-AT-0083]WPJ65660.1 hypothetical protein SMAC4_09550 [Sordaria macrospora]
MTSQIDNMSLEAHFEACWSISWYARYKCARSNFSGVWVGPSVPVEVVDLWKRCDWHDLLNGTGGVPAENTYRQIIENLKSLPEDERKITNYLCGAVPMESMPMYDRPDGPYWRATRAHNVLHKDVRTFEEKKLGVMENKPLTGLYVSPHPAPAPAGADAEKDEPPITIVPVSEEQ